MIDKEYVEHEYVDDEFPGIGSSIYIHSECLEHLFKPPYYDETGKPLVELGKRVEAFLEANDTNFAILDGPPYRTCW